jgi:UDP:flavonoid glycosyltransferase YjiC (YdhE family)
VLAATSPGASVFFQMAPLLAALQAAGHEVRVATSARFAATVRGAGLTPEAAGIDWLESALHEAFPEVAEHRRDPHGALVRFVVDVFVRRTSPRFAQDVISLLGRWKPDLVLHGVNEFGGAAAAERAGIPHLMLMAGIDNWLDRIAPALSGVDECRTRIGLAPAEGDSAWLFSNGVVLAEAPGWSARALEGAAVTWLRPVSPEQPAEDLAWLARLPRPVVHVTLGTVFNKLARPLFGVLAVGSASAAASVVMTVGSDLDPASIAGLPPNVHVRRYVALAPLLELCDAVLAHAGWGTLIACADAAAPMGAIVFGADHGYNAHIVERCGWGLALEPQDCSPASVAETTRRLLTDPALRSAAERQQNALRELPSPVDVAAALARRFG